MKISGAFTQKNPALQSLRHSAQGDIGKNESAKRLQRVVNNKNSNVNEDTLSPELEDKLSALTRKAETMFGSDGGRDLMRMLRTHLQNLQNADQGRAEIIEEFNEFSRQDQEKVDHYQSMLDGREPLDISRPAMSREEYERQGPHTQVTHMADGAEMLMDVDYDVYKTSWDADQAVIAREHATEMLGIYKNKIENSPPDLLEQNLAFYDFGLKKSREIVESIIGRLTGQEVSGGNKFDSDFWKRFSDTLTSRAEKGKLENEEIESIFSNFEKMSSEEKGNRKAYEEIKKSVETWLSKFNQQSLNTELCKCQ